MDENDLRYLLGEIANRAAPPTSVSAARAARLGIRRMWLRWTGLSGAAIGAVAAAAVVAAGGIAPFGHGQPQRHRAADAGRSRHHPGTSSRDVVTTSPAHALRVFDVTRPYVSFGWLPAGYAAYPGGNAGVGVLRQVRSAMTSEWSAGAISPAAGVEIDLYASTAQGCRITGPVTAGQRRYPASFSCPGYSAQPLVTAPPVGGKRAFWEGSGLLLWRYAPGAFADIGAEVRQGGNYDPAGSLITPGPPRRDIAALLLRAASHALFGYHGHILFGFQLHGPLPAGWQVGESSFMSPSAGGRPDSLLGQSISLGPASGPVAPLSITVMPVASLSPLAIGCHWDPTSSRHVRIGHVEWTLSTERHADGRYDRHLQLLCVSERGMMVDVELDLDQHVPGASSLGGIINVGRHLRIFGPNPAGWTPDPIG